jgi:hypothetical protein
VELKKDSIPPIKKQWHPMILGVIGVKEIEPPDGKQYVAFGIQANIYRTLNYKTKLGAGIEAAYNNATKKMWENDSVYVTSASDIIQSGVKVCYSFNMHRVSIPIDFGVYLYKKQKTNGLFFHRIGIRYLVTKHLIANVSLLTHWAKADYFEWGLGYQF